MMAWHTATSLSDGIGTDSSGLEDNHNHDSTKKTTATPNATALVDETFK